MWFCYATGMGLPFTTAGMNHWQTLSNIGESGWAESGRSKLKAPTESGPASLSNGPRWYFEASIFARAFQLELCGRPDFRPPWAIGWGARYLIDESANHRAVPLFGHGCNKSICPGHRGAYIPRVFSTRVEYCSRSL